MMYDGVGPAELAQRLKAPSCLSLLRVTSTLDIIHQLAGEGAPAGTVVLAEEQVAGRGRRGRSWYSPPRQGIWLGYLMRPSSKLESGVLAIRVGIAIVEALEELGAAASLKWPNDVVIDGRKLAGTLCEVRWLGERVQWIAVGIGMNIHGALPPEIASSAVTLETVRPAVTRLDVLAQVVPRLHTLSDATELQPSELRRFARYDWLRNARLVEPLAGTGKGIDHLGALLVETESGIERVQGGSVVAA